MQIAHVLHTVLMRHHSFWAAMNFSHLKHQL
jgi:hypothetical protein